MPKYIVSQTIDLDLQWVIEAENADDAIAKAHNMSPDKTKIVNVDHLSWDTPYDVTEADEPLSYLGEESLLVYMNAGIF